MNLRVILVVLFASCASLYAQTSEKELFMEAEGRFRSKDYELALDRYDTFLQRYPRSQFVPDAHFRRSVALFRMGRYDESYALLQRIEQRFASTRYISFVPFWKGVVQYERGEYADSARILEDFLRSSNDPELRRQALLYKGMSEAELGSQDKAVSSFEALLSLAERPGNEPAAVAALFSLLNRQRRYDRIIEIYEQLQLETLSLSYRDRISLYAAEAYLGTGRTERAAEVYRQLVSAPPEISSVAYQRLFQLAQRSGDIDAPGRLLAEAEKALAGMPGVLKEFWFRVGIESYERKKFDLAEYYFRRVWDLRETEQISDTVPFYLAEIYAQRREYQKGVAVLEAYLAKDAAREGLAQVRLGELAISMENWEKASRILSTFRSTHSDSPVFGQGSYLYAFTLYKMGRNREALAEIQRLFESGRHGGYASELLRLQSTIYRKQGDTEKAVESLRQYVSLNPKDASVRTDFLKLLFSLRDFTGVIRESRTLFRDIPEMDRQNPESYIEARYLQGLSHISLKQYAAALEALQPVLDAPAAGSADVIQPYSLFYRGWALYRIARFADAAQAFVSFYDRNIDHDLAPRAAYFAGWCYYNLAQYDKAHAYLARLAAMNAPDALLEKGAFLDGKTLAAQGKNREAAISFQNIYRRNPSSEFADDSMYEHAGILIRLGRLDDAVEEYRYLAEQYPSSPLRDVAMFKRGEVLYEAERYPKAKDAFYEYRTRFPNGKQTDAALYWGGLSAYEMGEKFGAVLLWERIIQEFRESTFRSDAMRRSAEVYAESGDHRKALNLYTELIAAYPQEARAMNAETRAEELRYLLLGLSDREAELSVVIGREGGAKTRRGREAMLELARLYIYDGNRKEDLALSMLENVIAKLSEDPEAAARARYLKGEYFAVKNQPERAADVFLEAATTNPKDQDLMAQSIYRAAEMMNTAGKRAESERLVKRLEEYFPLSPWAAEGKRLLEGKR